MLKAKKVIILGSTGSIGANALDVIRALSPQLEVAALSCHRSVDKLAVQVEEFAPQAVAITGDGGRRGGKQPAGLSGVRVYRGEQGLLEMLGAIEADIVLNGIAGARGLLPSLRCLETGKDLALANKETIVMAGPLVLEQAAKTGANLLPVDSEHHALFMLLRSRKKEEVSEVILTASGGAFRNLSQRELAGVAVEDALQHPNWEMGAKITVDSASMANKGLEVIEAHYLFDLPVSAIKVLIHPQSSVHSLVRTADGFLYAQLSRPDMRLSIQNALTFPRLAPSRFPAFDLCGQSLSFQPVDMHKYRLLALAYEAAERSDAYPIVYNAANEIAVAQFLSKRISFLEIARLVEETLQRDWSGPARTIEQILAVDSNARRTTAEILERMKRIA